jgi:hypothetical protein
MPYRLFPYLFVGKKLWNKVLEIQGKIGYCKKTVITSLKVVHYFGGWTE